MAVRREVPVSTEIARDNILRFPGFSWNSPSTNPDGYELSGSEPTEIGELHVKVSIVRRSAVACQLAVDVTGLDWERLARERKVPHAGSEAEGLRNLSRGYGNIIAYVARTGDAELDNWDGI